MIIKYNDCSKDLLDLIKSLGYKIINDVTDYIGKNILIINNTCTIINKNESIYTYMDFEQIRFVDNYNYFVELITNNIEKFKNGKTNN